MKLMDKSFDSEFITAIKEISKSLNLLFIFNLKNFLQLFFKVSFITTSYNNYFEQYLDQLFYKYSFTMILILSNILKQM